MKDIPDKSVDMILCDPPYSSGRLYAQDRKQSTSVKYFNTDYSGAARFPDFSGDNMDQHSFTEFMQMVLFRCRTRSKSEAVAAIFIDWRNLSAVIDALQGAGWIYRGIVVWDKGNSRPIPNRFRNDCEYIAWGTNGARKAVFSPGAMVLPGCYHVKSIASKNKHHQTEKPIELLQALLAICPEGGTMLDPFMGSDSTGRGCVNTDRDFIGIKLETAYFEMAKQRIEAARERIKSLVKI